MSYLKMMLMVVLTISSVTVFAQDSTTQKTKTSKQQSQKIQYSCSMHPEVTSEKPGKCSKCGMTLTKSTKPLDTKLYVCPMHPDVTSDKPGKCPKCSMALKEKKVG